MYANHYSLLYYFFYHSCVIEQFRLCNTQIKVKRDLNGMREDIDANKVHDLGID